MYRIPLLHKVPDKVFSPLPLLILAAILITGIVAEALSQIDRSADKQYKEFIQASIDQQLRSIGDQAMDYAWWDEAIIQLVDSPNQAWADANVGSYMSDNFGISINLVLSQNDEIISSFQDGIYSNDQTYLLDNITLHKLVQSARGMSLTNPTPIKSLIRVGDKIFMVGAFPFTPEDEVPPPARGSMSLY